MNTNLNVATDRDEIEQLLPWHAAGTLNRRDAQRVEEALARDPELARRFALVREELSETIHLNETLGAPSARAMEKLFTAIETESGPARQAKPGFSLTAWISERLSALSPRTLAYATAGAALAIVLQFGVLTGVAVNTALKQDGGFQTASGPSIERTGPGTYALIGFGPNVPVGDVTAFLERHQLVLAGGPLPNGIYRVRIAAKAVPQAERDQIIARLKGETSVVRFIAPTE